MNVGDKYSPEDVFGHLPFPKWLLQMKGISYGAKILWALMVRHCDEDGYARTGQDFLADKMGCSRRRIQSMTDTLINQRLIEAVGPDENTSCDRYRFLTHPDMDGS